MPHADFVHLRVHTAYSLLEGAVRVADLAGLCRAMGQPAVAMTDSNNIFGAMEFGPACARAGVQPIIGCLLRLRIPEPDDEPGRARPAAQGPAAAPIPVLVQDARGYANLLKLLAIAYLGEDGGGAPTVSPGDLKRHGGGLIALTGGPAGPVGRLLRAGPRQAAEAMLAGLAEAFPGRLYVEMMRHGMPEEAASEPAFLDMAYAQNLPLVATNDVHFATRDMYEAHDALICIADGAYVSQRERRRMTPEHYLKPAAEMRALFADLPEAIDNSLVIARRCAYQVETREPLLPPYDCGEGRGEVDELRAQSHAGLDRRLAGYVLTAAMDPHARADTEKRYRERLDYELEVIAGMGFPGYFLIVAEFIGWAKRHGIPVGPGRGSGAGSLVAWALDITDLDPIRWGLLFERFLNPERVSLPDFDIDFCQDKRDQVIRHVQEKYGRGHVAQIVTFGKLQARAVLRDVGRVLEMPYGQVDAICKLVPNDPAKPCTLSDAINQEPRLREETRNDANVAHLVEIAKKLEGLYRHSSTHAAGVVIGDRPLQELIPLYRDPGSDMPVTGYNMKYVETTGLIKFDFLGLKTLTVLDRAAQLIGQGGGQCDLAALPLDDAKTFEMLGHGQTVGVFQLESSGMQEMLIKLKPDSFEDIIAIVALYRPGPMENIPSYIERKHGREIPDYLYPTLEGILTETFGIMIYQEQVMQIAQELSGYSLGGADLLRRAMGKKNKAEMDAQHQAFIEGAQARGVPEAKAEQIFEQVNKFAGYGFNKSHAAAYALIAYQTAYLKANHPVEFIAASMTLDSANTDKLNIFRQELQRLDIDVLPPDINLSGVIFTVEAGAVRYALAAVKGVGKGAMEALVQERAKAGPFASLADFATRIDNHVINRKQIENLVRAGAFDALNSNRRQVAQATDSILAHAQLASSERNSNQIGLFGGDDVPVADLQLEDVPDWPPMERLKNEFEAVGFYLSAHPLDAYGAALARLDVRSASEILAQGRGGPVTMAGTVTGIKERTSAKGHRFAFVQCSDASGSFELTVFSEILAKARDFLIPGQAIFIRASAQIEGESVRFTTNAIEPLDKKVTGRGDGQLRITIASAEPLPALRQALELDGGGRGRVHLVTRLDDDTEVDLDLHQACRVSPQVIQAVLAIPGVLTADEL